jgi:hypothetical protein
MPLEKHFFTIKIVASLIEQNSSFHHFYNLPSFEELTSGIFGQTVFLVIPFEREAKNYSKNGEPVYHRL